MEGKGNFLQEHNYFKITTNEEVMDVTPSISSSNNPFLSNLTDNRDNPETVFLSLLKLYGQDLGGVTTPKDPYDINPQALDCLSNEQINFLVTSSSVNYDALQQILTQRSKQATPISNNKNESSDSSQTVTNGNHGTTPTFTLSTKQLQDLQAQLITLLRQQNLQLNQLPLDQQQQLISSLLNQQLLQMVATPTSGAVQPIVTPPPSYLYRGNDQSLLDQEEPVVLLGNEAKKEHVTSDTSKRVLPAPFQLYFNDVYPSLEGENPNLSLSEASKIVSTKWNNLLPADKQRYHDKHEEMKKDFAAKQIGLAPKPDTPTLLDSPTTPTFEPLSLLTTPPPKSLVVKRQRKPSKELVDMKGEKSEGMCMATGCLNMAVPSDDRGKSYCSNECIVNHCRSSFIYWIHQRKHRT